MIITEALESKLRGQMGSWYQSFLPFIESVEMDKIFAFLKASSAAKKTIIPKSGDLFKSLEKCDKQKLKAVIVLSDPYANVKGDIIAACGIPLDSSNTGIIQSHLSIFYHGIENTYGFDIEMDIRANISYLLEEEHVLLINSSLSVEKDKPGSHAVIWVEFMKHFFKILNEEHRGLPIILLGAQAQKYEKEINPLLHYVLKAEHMETASQQNRHWKYNDMFMFIDRILESNNGVRYKVQWSRKKGEQKKYADQYPEWITGKKEDTKSAQELSLPWED